LNQILKCQTSRFLYGSKVPAVTITVFITILEQNRHNSCQSSTKFSEEDGTSPSATPSHLKYFNYESKCQKNFYVTQVLQQDICFICIQRKDKIMGNKGLLPMIGRDLWEENYVVTYGFLYSESTYLEKTCIVTLFLQDGVYQRSYLLPTLPVSISFL
jgi:hypothetical protein